MKHLKIRTFNKIILFNLDYQDKYINKQLYNKLTMMIKIHKI